MTPSAAWRMAGTSVAGPRHASKEDCQDRHRLHVTPGGVLIAVVSDGAGSAKYGGLGAALLCDQIVEGLSNHFARPQPRSPRARLKAICRAIQDAVAVARTAAEGLGEAREVGIEAFHATLVGALMVPGEGGLFFHIGDGAALALAGQDGRWLLSAPQNGEYADTTYFFTEPEWKRNLRFKTIDGGYDTIFVMSDGVTELALKHAGNGAEPFMPFFEPIGRFLASASREEGEQALQATLDSSAVRERTSDDKTLVWASAR